MSFKDGLKSFLKTVKTQRFGIVEVVRPRHQKNIRFLMELKLCVMMNEPTCWRGYCDEQTIIIMYHNELQYALMTVIKQNSN